MGREMPANLVKGKDADAVASYVAEAVGRKAGGYGRDGRLGRIWEAAARPRPTRSNEVEIPTDPSGQLAYKFKSAEAKAGKVTLLSKNDASVPHDIAIKGGGVDKQGSRCRTAAPPR